MWERIELCGFRMGAGRTGATTVPVWSLTHVYPIVGHNLFIVKLFPKGPYLGPRWSDGICACTLRW